MRSTFSLNNGAQRGGCLRHRYVPKAAAAQHVRAPPHPFYVIPPWWLLRMIHSPMRTGRVCCLTTQNNRDEWRRGGWSYSLAPHFLTSTQPFLCNQPRSMKHSVKDLFGSHGKFMERTYLTHMTASDSWPLAPPSICGVT